MADRTMIDCRKVQGSQGCTLAISGRKEEVEAAAADHACAIHGFPDTPETRSRIGSMIEPERPAQPEQGRKVADCRAMPSKIGCTLTFSGREDEVTTAAKRHAIAMHEHEDSPDLARAIRDGLKDEASYRPPEMPSQQA